MKKEKLEISKIKQAAEKLGKKYGVAQVALFGSYATGNADFQSDVDLIIEKGKMETLFQLIGFRQELEDILHVNVDVITSETSDKKFLQQIAKDMVVIYAAA